jgi:hypothetical protein
MSRGERFRAALAGEALAFAPIVWEQLPELVRQPQAGWWRDATLGQRLIADAATLAQADAMFVFVAAEAIRSAALAGDVGDDAIDALAQSDAAVRGAALVSCLHEVTSSYAVIAAVPAPAVVVRELGGDEPEPAEDAFSDLALSYLQAGADALAVTGAEVDEVRAGVARAAQVGGLFGRPVLGMCLRDGSVEGWVHGGAPLGVVSASGEWPAGVGRGLLVTRGDVGARWTADQLRAAGSARP